MIRNYSVLRTTLMQPGAGYAQPTQVVPEKVTFDDAAAAVMTAGEGLCPCCVPAEV